MPLPASLPMRLKRCAAPTVLVAVLLFAVTATWLQFVRSDLDWVRATLSLYLHGPGGLWLRSAYCFLAVGIILLGGSLYAQLRGAARRGLPVALFGMAGLGLAGVAIGDSWLPAYTPLLAPLVHGLSAQMAFLCVTVAMLVQAWCFGRDVRWRRWHRPAWWWAWLTFAALWGHVLWRASPRGLGQKLVIALVVGWLLMVTLALWRAGRKEPAETSGSGHNNGHSHHRESAP